MLLERPSTAEKWTRCLIPSADCNWLLIKHLPSVHVVGKVPEEVAVRSSCIPWLRDHGFPFQVASEPGPDAPGVGRGGTSRLVLNAAERIWSDGGAGLGQYYRDYHPEIPEIEWAILIRAIVCFRELTSESAADSTRNPTRRFSVTTCCDACSSAYNSSVIIIATLRSS
jgi:hypothetical protein